MAPTQWLILNKNVNENDGNDDDDYKFFWKKKDKKQKKTRGGGQGGQSNKTSTLNDIFIVTPSPERLLTKAKEASSCVVRWPCCTPSQYFLVSAITIFDEIIWKAAG